MTGRPTSLPRAIIHPGPVGERRLFSLPVDVAPLRFTVAAGERLGPALAAAILARGLDGAYLRLRDIPVGAFEYVIPDRAHDGVHVAWYSQTRRPALPAAILDAGIVCGFAGGAVSFHAHGRLRGGDGREAMGHFLLDAITPAADTEIGGLAFRGARFTRRPDSETRFDLLEPQTTPQPAAPDADARLLRLAPNVDFAPTLAEHCRDLGWEAARIDGVGSLIGARFDDGRVFDSFATEFLIEDGRIDLAAGATPARIDIALAGFDDSFARGRISRHPNPVLITAELLLRRA